MDDSKIDSLPAATDLAPVSSQHVEILVLDEKPQTPKIDWTIFWPIPVCSAAYGIHRYYRRYRPRRLPVLTPMKLPSLYISTAVVLTAFSHIAHLGNTVAHDDDLLVISLASSVVKHSVHKHPRKEELYQKLDDSIEELGVMSRLRSIRELRYNQGTSLGKLRWWHDHVWTSEQTWMRWAMLTLLQEVQSEGQLTGIKLNEDFDVVVTHLSNCSMGESTPDLVKAFTLFIPFAMLARWSGRSFLARPANGLQRLLFGAWIYGDIGKEHQHWAYIHQIREKHEWAKRLDRTWGPFDETVKRVRSDGESIVD